jgi:hypothetical protein
LPPSTVFKTAAFNRSATLPGVFSMRSWQMLRRLAPGEGLAIADREVSRTAIPGFTLASDLKERWPSG